MLQAMHQKAKENSSIDLNGAERPKVVARPPSGLANQP
jgi:hypothetical protein